LFAVSYGWFWVDERIQQFPCVVVATPPQFALLLTNFSFYKKSQTAENKNTQQTSFGLAKLLFVMVEATGSSLLVECIKGSSFVNGTKITLCNKAEACFLTEGRKNFIELSWFLKLSNFSWKKRCGKINRLRRHGLR
jgi:hypothetical protein